MFDRFDICEAYYALECDWNNGGFIHERRSARRLQVSIATQLHRMRFKGRPSLGGRETLTENGRRIYDLAVRRWRLGADTLQHTADDLPSRRNRPMTLKEYEQFRADVNDFFEREEIENLSQVDSEDSDTFFSWSPCECCGSRVGGDRTTCEGYSRVHEEVRGPYDVCPDCYYFAEYGELDDTTMMEMTSGVIE